MQVFFINNNIQKIANRHVGKTVYEPVLYQLEKTK